MPRVRNTSGRDYISERVGRVNAGESVEVADADAKYLVGETDYFELVDDDGSDDDVEEQLEKADDDDSEESEAEGFDVDAWLEQDFRDREECVRTGDVDEHLDAIAEEETSDTVLDAIGERRAELEG